MVMVSVAIKEGYKPCRNCYKKKVLDKKRLQPQEERSVRKIRLD